MAQTWNDMSKEDMSIVFENMNKWFKNTPSYSLTVTHASYKDYKTTVPAEKSVGYFKKDKKSFHSFLLGIHTIQNEKYKIVVDTAQKIIMLGSPELLISNSYTMEDYAFILKSCKSIKMATYTNDKLYRIEFSANTVISSYEFLIGQDGLLKQIVWYYNQAVRNEDEENSIASKPRLCISFSDYKKNSVFNYKEDFDEKKYVTLKDSKFVLTEKYRKYKINDIRLVLN